MLCSKLHSYVAYGPLEGGICPKVGLPTWFEALGLENCLSKDTHPRHLLGLDENGGVYEGQRPLTPQG